MSVLIKGMEMPTSCVYRENGHLMTCPLYDIDGYCGALHTEACHKVDETMLACPAIPVPPHGRLIDADALLKTNNPIGKTMVFGGEYVYTESEIDSAPTIIEAEEGE